MDHINRYLEVLQSREGESFLPIRNVTFKGQSVEDGLLNYLVSSFGRVFSLYHMHFLTQLEYGYLSIELHKSNAIDSSFTIAFHRLVAATFIDLYPRRYQKYYINHIRNENR
jgi:hypothetical protein